MLSINTTVLLYHPPSAWVTSYCILYITLLWTIIANPFSFVVN